MVTLTEAAGNIQKFEQGSLTNRISTIESKLQNADKAACKSLFQTLGINLSLLDSAFVLKRATGQVNVLIHAAGILLSLPHILEVDEVIESLSLGAGNTGKSFDLETNHRIAEFKFISWKGGSESIRQNQLFKDFYLLAEYDTLKKRCLYVVGIEHPLKFLKGGRALSSVMSRNNKLWTDFKKRYGERFSRVCDYYEYRKSLVHLMDITKIVPQFQNMIEFDNEEISSNESIEI
jgi:hypothetical protein